MTNEQIKIFSEEKPISFSGKAFPSEKKTAEKKDTLYYDGEKELDIPDLLASLKEKGKITAVISGENIAEVKKKFFAAFEVIEAAGGIVQNDKKDILFIFRKGKWDLPKGKMDEGENAEACAEREIEEETGVKGLKLKKKIGDTYHIYKEKGRNILKISRWFYFTCSSDQDIAPQTEEDITEVKWIPTQKIKEPMNNTYETIKDIMREFFDKP